MKSRRVLLLIISALGAVAAVAAAALYLSGRRDVTTSSADAYRAYREGIENEQRFYLKEARLDFARALQGDPEFAMAMLGLARNSDRDQAKSLVDRARRLRSRLTDLERLNVDMEWAYTNGKSDQGLQIARTIHEKYPKDPRATLMLASEEVAQGNTEQATRTFAQLLAIDPNNASAYNQIGYYYAYHGEYDKAIENLKRYQFLAPDQANPYDSMGEIQANLGRYDDAIANLNRALAIKPDFDPAYQHLGVAYEGKGDYAKAIECYEKAAANAVVDGLRAAYLTAALHAAFWLQDRAQTERLIAEIERLPKNPFSELRKVYFDAVQDLLAKRPADAEKILRENKPKLLATISKSEQSARYKPYDAGWNLLMGMALERQGKDAEAIPVYEEMANPPNAPREFDGRRWVCEGRARLAAVLVRRGDLDRAEKLLAENHQWNPNWAPAHAAEEAVAQAERQRVLAASK